jgi:inositol oxygenase
MATTVDTQTSSSSDLSDPDMNQRWDGFTPTHKEIKDFRVYDGSNQTVVEHYRDMRMNQTLEFSRRMQDKFTFANGGRTKMTIKEGFEVLKTFVDASDPDVSLPNMVHMLQTSEGMRAGGYPDWMQLCGLIHDMGKMMFLWGKSEDGMQGTADGKQWALGGDTWVVGCRIPDCTILNHLNQLNPDMIDERYNTENGIYEPGCGMANLNYAYGHDEYMYQMLVANETLIPPEGLAMIRYHSCYPWHTGGAYRQFMAPGDHKLMAWVIEFNKFDLYTKDQAGLKQTPEELWPYYQTLIDKYLPNEKKNGSLIW